MQSHDGSGADVLIAGTGAGGAALGHALAQAGHSVLFVELGQDLAARDSLRGVPAEATPQYNLADAAQRRNLLVRSGRNPDCYLDGRSGEPFVPYVGHGTGGSTSLYGMVLERRYPHDFEGWPVQYEELAPWYERAERLYEVNGSADPLRAPEPGCAEPVEPLSAANQSLFGGLERAGLHPYRLHLASRRLVNCKVCQGYLCDSAERCKNDARVTCVGPALDSGRARLLSCAKVIRLEGSNRRVSAAVVRMGGEERRLTAKLYVLAAGALATPEILLNSGIGERSGLVGRRLMRHAIDLFVLSLGPRHEHARESKELGLNDYYAGSGEWLGTVQSFGMAPSLEYLRNQPGRNLWKMLGPAAAPVARLFSGAPIVASILEDKPSPENRVELDRAGRRIHYRLVAADRARRSRLRRKVLRAFARFAPVPVFGTSDRPALGHVCGTAVFGDDPQTSVLDGHNRRTTSRISTLWTVRSFRPAAASIRRSRSLPMPCGWRITSIRRFFEVSDSRAHPSR